MSIFRENRAAEAPEIRVEGDEAVIVNADKRQGDERSEPERKVKLPKTKWA
jgi:hypothetical protein